MADSSLTIIQKGAQSSGLLKKVFTQGNSGVSAAQMVMELNQVLKLVGVQLPPDVEVGLDSVQFVLAGGAVVSDLAKGAATLQVVGDAAVGVSAVSDALSTLGIIPHEATDFIGLGTNVALVLASGGANVLADLGAVISLIQCAIDVAPALFGSSAIAESAAKRELAVALSATQGAQVQNAASLVQQFNQSKLNLFDMIGQIALTDPEAFASVFPGLAVCFPTWSKIDLTATGGSVGLFATQIASASTSLFKLVTTKQQVQDVIVEQYLTTPMQEFESFQTVAPLISLQAVSVLALILQTGGSGDVCLNYNFNIIGAMRALGVTPAILGDDWLFKGLQRNEKEVDNWAAALPYQPVTLPWVTPVTSGSVVNGVETFTNQQSQQNQQAQELIQLQTLMQQYDESGDIESLLQIPEAVAMLTRWAQITVQPAFYAGEQHDSDVSNTASQIAALQQELASVSSQTDESVTINQINAEIAQLQSRVFMPVGEITNMALIGTSITSQSWFDPNMSTDPATVQGAQFWNFVNANYQFDVSNYWRILQTLASMQASDLFQDDTQVQDFQGSISAITSVFNDAYGFVQCKSLNANVRAQLAQSLGIPVESLAARYDSQGNLIFYQKAS